MRKGKRTLLLLALITAFVAMGLFLPGLARAGELEPPPGAVDGSGKPIPTMHTLDEIYNKLGDIDSKLAGARVEKTGQTTSYATGDDGDLERGVACTVPRFTDNGDGTVTDNLTGLIWLKNANRFGTKQWSQALTDCLNLADDGSALTDGSSVGDWRLPNVKELQSLVDYGRYNPALPSWHPFINVQLDNYWSSTTCAHYASDAWYVYLYVGYVYNHDKTYTFYVWPVRSGN